MNKDIYSVYCWWRFCSFLTKFGKKTYILVAVMSFNAEISIL